jgi:hypothetical protein
MQVTRYQMQNVLQCYGKKLTQTRRNGKPAGSATGQAMHELALPPEISRRVTMDKISRQVLDRIADVVAISCRNREAPPPEPWRPAAPGTGEKPAIAQPEAFTRSAADAAAENLGDRGKGLEHPEEETEPRRADSWV